MDVEISQQMPISAGYYPIRDQKCMFKEFAKRSSGSEKESKRTNLYTLIINRMVQNSEGKLPTSLIMEKEADFLTVSPLEKALVNYFRVSAGLSFSN